MDEDQWEAASESLFPFSPLFSTRPCPGFGFGRWGGGGGVRHGVFVLGYHSSAFFAVYPHQSSSPALPSRDPVVAPRSWSSFASMLLPPAPPCTVHVIVRRSGWFFELEFPSLFMTRMLGRTGNTKSGVCRFSHFLSLCVHFLSSIFFFVTSYCIPTPTLPLVPYSIS